MLFAPISYAYNDKYRDSIEYCDTFARYLSWKKFYVSPNPSARTVGLLAVALRCSHSRTRMPATSSVVSTGTCTASRVYGFLTAFGYK